MGHFAWGAMRCFRKLFALPFRFVTQGSLELSNDGRAKDCDVPARDQQRSIDDYQETRCDPGSVGAVASIPRHKPSWKQILRRCGGLPLPAVPKATSPS